MFKLLYGMATLNFSNFETQGCQYVIGQKNLNLFLRIRGVAEQSLRHFFITQVVLITSMKRISSSVFSWVF